MKNISLSVAFALFVSTSFSQAILVTPNDTFTSNMALVNFMDQVTEAGFVENNTNSADTIFWYVSDINHPVDWEMSVCDKVSCYIIYQTGELHRFDIASHTQDLLHFLCTPNCAAGDGNIELTMWLKSDSAGTVIHPRYLAAYTGVCNTGITEAINESIKVFPSHFTSQITVEGIETAAVKSIKLLNLNGDCVNHVKIFSGNAATIETSKLSAGIYFLRLETANGIASKKLVKE